MTATPRTGVARFTFPKGRSHILLNLGEGLTNETGAFLRQTGECEFEGMKLLGTFCYNPQAVFPVYFVMRVNKTPLKTGYWKKQRPMTGVEAEWDPDNGKYKLYTGYRKELAGDDIGAFLTFDTGESEQIEVQMGVSFVSIENAVSIWTKNSPARTSTRYWLKAVNAGTTICRVSLWKAGRTSRRLFSIRRFIMR